MYVQSKCIIIRSLEVEYNALMNIHANVQYSNIHTSISYSGCVDILNSKMERLPSAQLWVDSCPSVVEFFFH